ncbi:MAG: helix-turn-helix transcriptional regulator [Candidatus Bathyarchaeia archaeon]
MRSRILFLIVAVGVAISVISLVLGLGTGWGGRGYGMGRTFPQSIWLLPVVVPLIIVVTVLGYATLFPELSEKELLEKPSISAVEKGEATLDAVLRVLKEDERKVIETLVAEGGTMLQKDIRWKTGFSRVKTHRILYRLAERGLVSAEKYYNTNKITLAKWLVEEKSET